MPDYARGFHGHVPRWQVRPFSQSDAADVMRLAAEGLLPGYPPHDPLNLELFSQTCPDSSRSRFWVAEAGSRIIGTVALAEVTRDVAHLRWLRVAPEWQHGDDVVRHLAAVAVDYAREMDFLKLLLFAPTSPRPDIAPFLHRLGFEFSRTKGSAGGEFLEFYMNLYEQPDLSDTTSAQPT